MELDRSLVLKFGELRYVFSAIFGHDSIMMLVCILAVG